MNVTWRVATTLLGISHCLEAQQPLRVAARRDVSTEYSVDRQAAWSVGGTLDDPSLEFEHRNGLLNATATRSGLVIVVDGSRLHLFDERRHSHAIVGRRGAGPNEFVSLSSACTTRGDTIVAYDVALRRVSVISKEGDFVRQFTLPNQRPMMDGACSPDGTVAFQESGSLVDGISEGRVLRFDLQGRMLGPIGRARIGTASVRPQLVGTAKGILVADPRSDTIRILSASGEVTRMIVLGDPSEPMRPEEANSAGLIARRGGAAPPTAAARDMVIWPRFGRILAGLDGRIWIERFRRESADDGEWLVLDTSGTAAGIVRVPRSMSSAPHPILVAADSNSVLLLVRDEEGAARVSRFRLTRSARRGR